MNNITPATNITLATIAGFLAVILEHVLSTYNIVIPPDVKAGLPAVIAVAVAHISDLITHDNKK